MANRFLLKQFGGDSEINQVFGSYQAGDPKPTNDPEEIQSLDAWGKGWPAATTNATKIPRMEEVQGVEYVLCKAIKELYSEGVPLWLAGETYYKDSYCKYDGKLYINITGTNGASAPDTDQTNWKELSLGGRSHVVGEIVSVFGTSSYVPFGCVLADGTEYTKALFPSVWSDYLTAATPLLPICTYSEYAADITAYGQCAKFAVDAENETFKVPTVKNKIINDLTGVPVVGNGMTIGLTDGNGHYGLTAQAEAGTSGSLAGWTNSYGESDGVPGPGTGERMSFSTVGLTTDSSKSGLETTAGDNSNGVEVRFFVCLAGGVINESMIDWQNYMTALAGKADTDLSNVTTAGKDVMAGMGMPSGEYVDLTLGASGESYTAPAQGYVDLTLGASGESYTAPAQGYVYAQGRDNGYILLKNSSGLSTFSPAIMGIANGQDFLPVAKGGTFYLEYANTPAYFRFYYAEGSK